MGFLKAVLVVLLVYYLFRILARLFAPKIFAYAARKTEERFRQEFEKHQSSASQERPVGEVSIDKRSTGTKRTTKEVGEYIDFEELE